MLRSLVCLRSSVARRLCRDDRGASAVEYSVLIALIAAVIILVVTALGQKVSGAFQGIVSIW
jgi:pilus assembly protein Flp/PilA